MTNGVQNSGDAGIGPNLAEQTPVVQAQPASADTVSLERYKELEAFATRARQNEIANAVIVAKANPKFVSEISDAKVQNAVVKEIYGLDNLAEVQEAFGKDYWKTKDAGGDGESEDKVASLEKEVKLMRLRGQSDRVNAEIEKLKFANPNLIKSEKDEEALRAEMRLISAEVSPEERVKKAARLAFGDVEANKANAMLNSQSASSGGSAAPEKNTNAEQYNRSELVKFLSSYSK